VIKTAGKWDPKEPPIYFIAADTGALKLGAECHTHLLCALDRIQSENDLQDVRKFIRDGKVVMLDSGVFFLAMRHAEQKGITLAEALSTPPGELDGFADLFEDYVALMKEIGHTSWGYVEIDQGGRDNKIKTRAKLEAMGLRPIPVYHPLTDGWDYFDYLAQRYDRICFGNVVHADRATRKRMLATAWSRKQKYPNLWVHMLGHTPSETCNAYPTNSCDSSTWLAMARWPADRYQSTCALQAFSAMPHEFSYRLDSDSDSETGSKKAKRWGGYESYIMMRTLRGVQKDFGRLV
jgi:hypothetical protein